MGRYEFFKVTPATSSASDALTCNTKISYIPAQKNKFLPGFGKKTPPAFATLGKIDAFRQSQKGNDRS